MSVTVNDLCRYLKHSYLLLPISTGQRSRTFYHSQNRSPSPRYNPELSAFRIALVDPTSFVNNLNTPTHTSSAVQNPLPPVTNMFRTFRDIQRIRGTHCRVRVLYVTIATAIARESLLVSILASSPRTQSKSPTRLLHTCESWVHILYSHDPPMHNLVSLYDSGLHELWQSTESRSKMGPVSHPHPR